MRVARIGEQKHGLDVGELAVHLRHRHLVVEVGARAQPLHYRVDVFPTQVVDQQAGPAVDTHVGQIGAVLADQGDAFVDVEHALLVRVDHHGDDQRVEAGGGTLDDVAVTDGERVEGAGEDS